MELIRFKYKKQNLGELIIILGQFDGLHLAHQELINKAIAEAKKDNIKTAVLSFHPHPDFVLKKRGYQGYITPFKTKLKNLEKLGVDYWVIIPFTKAFSTLLPEEFETRVLDAFQVKKIFVGFDYHYGFKGQGNTETLKKKYPVFVLDEIAYKDQKMGSQAVRNLLTEGAVEEVAKILGRPYQISGIVVPGSQIGRKLGVNTANINLEEEYQELRHGVYAVKVFVKDREFLGVCNIGHNPSINYTRQPRLEVHILDFEEDIYGENISISFLKFLRPEIKYQDLTMLQAQIEADIQLVRKFEEKE